MKYIILIILLVAAAIFIFSRFQSQEKKSSIIPIDQVTLSTKTNSEGPVTIEATPFDIPNGQVWKFKIVLNTHSDELDQDLTKVVTLGDDKGNSYQPTSWEGSPSGGHHREGELFFESISPKPKSFSLTVKNIGGIAKRSFLWKLGGE